jgi:hypothetical protein
MEEMGRVNQPSAGNIVEIWGKTASRGGPNYERKGEVVCKEMLPIEF